VFEARKDSLDAKLCFSVVGKNQILDIQAQSKEMAELWVKGLRKLIGHSDEKSDKLAKQGLESGNLPGSNKNRGGGGGGGDDSQREKQAHNQRTKSLMLLQQDLFVMTTTTVFRNLEEERIWDIDQSVKERFNPKSLYELTLREDIPWRQWNQWIREKIVTYLRENGKMLNQNRHMQQQPSMNGGGMYGAPPQYGGHQQQASFGGHRPQQPSYHAMPQQGMYGQPMQQQPQQPMPMYNAQKSAQNMQMPPQQMNMPPQQQQVPPQGGAPQQGQGGDNGECSLM